MKKINYTLLFTSLTVVAVLTFVSCKSQEYNSLDEAEGKRLKFSYGGGFTGQYTTYVLLDNGQVFKSVGLTESFDQIGRVKKDVVDQIFSNYTTLGIGKRDIESYGNMNYSVAMKDGENEKKINWEKNQSDTGLLQKFYEISIKRIDKSDKPAKRNFKLEQ